MNTPTTLRLRPTTREIMARLLVVAIGLAAWFTTQSFLGARGFPRGVSTIDLRQAADVLLAGDAILASTAQQNAYLAAHDSAANALLIASSLLIDALGVFLLAWSVFGPSLRPFVGLLCLFALRQVSQVLCALPAPPGMIWRDPGFPSLLVTYDVANDFFFSGHTALAIFGAVELSRLERRGWALVAAGVALFEIAAVLLLRAHWTMDVLAGALAALYIARLSRWLGPQCDRALARMLGAPPLPRD
jgi:hypothetical protein